MYLISDQELNTLYRKHLGLTIVCLLGLVILVLFDDSPETIKNIIGIIYAILVIIWVFVIQHKCGINWDEIEQRTKDYASNY